LAVDNGPMYAMTSLIQADIRGGAIRKYARCQFDNGVKKYRLTDSDTLVSSINHPFTIIEQFVTHKTKNRKDDLTPHKLSDNQYIKLV